MTPEFDSALARAEGLLVQAKILLDTGHFESAARMAYYDTFHAAQAYIFIKTGKVTKTHRGMSTEFARLTIGWRWPNPNFRGFLARAFEYKQTADYGTDPAAWPGREEAIETAATARQFIHFIAAQVGDPA